MCKENMSFRNLKKIGIEKISFDVIISIFVPYKVQNRNYHFLSKNTPTRCLETKFLNGLFRKTNLMIFNKLNQKTKDT